MEYRVGAGDTISRIARRFNISPRQLLAANPQLGDPNRLRVGVRIRIPNEANSAGYEMPDNSGSNNNNNGNNSGNAPNGRVSLEEIPWVAWAAQEERAGIGEWHNGSSNPRIIEYHHTTNLDDRLASRESTSWCSSFVNWCFVQAGYRGTNSAFAREWLQWGDIIDEPQVGCVVIFKRGTSGGHVGFYLDSDSQGTVTLGGNQSHRVCIRNIPLPVLGYRMPSVGNGYENLAQRMTPTTWGNARRGDLRDLVNTDTPGRAVGLIQIARVRWMLGMVRR